jgi:Xaa-Pro aminopeptidase
MLDKAVKTKSELDGFRNCHVRDAAALCQYFGWLENELVEKGNENINEVDGPDYVGLSFGMS